MKLLKPVMLYAFTFIFVFTELLAQKRKKTNQTDPTLSFSSNLYEGLEWRNIGPFRGGRSAAVTGVSDQPNLFYFGSAGGGIWKTNDAGSSWENISDGYFGGSVGAIAVSDWDPNVIYAGGGEVTVRGNVSSGYGIWLSLIHISEPTRQAEISYAVFCLKKKKQIIRQLKNRVLNIC